MKWLLKLSFASAAVAGLLFTTGCSSSYTGWKSDVVINDMKFSRIRFSVSDGDTTTVIGYLKEDADINGYPCRAGWVHFDGGWQPRHFCLSRDHTVRNVDLPAGTWVNFAPDDNIFSVVFTDDTIFRGCHCMGRGGMNGVQTTFYSSGALRQFFPASDAVIDNVNCMGGVLHPVTLHENGKLLSCTLNEEITLEGKTIRKGTGIRIDTSGIITTDE